MAKKNNKSGPKPKTFEGLPLQDAKHDATLIITKEDATKSRKKDPARCAAALAGQREFHTDVRVYRTKMYVLDEKAKKWTRFNVPGSVQKEIISFDRGVGFEPGEYQFKAPTKSTLLGYNPNRGSYPTGEGKPKRPHHITTNVRVSALEKFGGGGGRK